MIIVLDAVQENIALYLDIKEMRLLLIEVGKVQKMSIKEIIRKILLVNNHSIIGALSILFPVEISSSLSFLSFSCDDCARW